MTAPFDLVVRNGSVADGLGGPLVQADIAIRDGLIVEVGRIAAGGNEEIDAAGLLVTPGFVDIHTHYDGQAVWDTRLQPSSLHGVTTVAMGNCGVGFAPVRESDRNRLIELMEGVEDIPGTALHEGLNWQWESFGEYLHALEHKHRDIDCCAYLPHGALRVYVMGERATRLEDATPEDIAQMRKLTEQAARAGAIGFSSSRSINHRSIKGEPTPSLRAAEDELLGIALGLRDAGCGVLQIISDFKGEDLHHEFALMRRMVEVSGRPLSYSLAQSHNTKEGWREVLKLTAQAVADDLPIRAQVAPRPIGVLMGLQASRNAFSACPAYQDIADLPLAERLALLRDPALRQTLVAELDAINTGLPVHHRTAFERIYPLGNPPCYEPAASTSMAARAAQAGLTPTEALYDAMLEDEGKAFLLAPFANYAFGNLDACRDMIADPNTVIGLGDGGAHVGMICDGSFPTYLLAHWGRDRATGKFDIPWLIKRQTSDTARTVGLLDRGVIAPGMKADINIIDLQRLQLDAPDMLFDLPAGGKRLMQRAHGYVATIVSGAVTYREGEPTGALPGRLIKGPQEAPFMQAVA